MKNLDAWQEEGLLYIKQEYCCEADLMIFLERLEVQKFNFNVDFYWDLIFEMICVRKFKIKLNYLKLLKFSRELNA